MAQPAHRVSQEISFSIKPFWERATVEPLIRLENLRTQIKLAILLGERVTVDSILKPKLTTVKLSPETK